MESKKLEQGGKFKSEGVKFSLRYKLLMLITSIPLLSMSLYLVLTTDLFKQDKEQFVHDSGVLVASSLGAQVRLEMESYLGRLKPIIERVSIDTDTISREAQQLFLKDDRFQAIIVFGVGSDGKYHKKYTFNKQGKMVDEFLKNKSVINRIKIQSKAGSFIFRAMDDGRNIAVGYRLSSAKDNRYLIAVALYKAKQLLELFSSKLQYQVFLINSTGDVVLGGDKIKKDGILNKAESVELFSSLTSSDFQGSELREVGSEKSVMMAYADIGFNGYKTISLVDQKEAFKAVAMMVAKSILFFIALIATTVIVSLIASIQLTSTLRELYMATRKIASGNFDIQVDSNSSDEVGGLANSFNWMAKEVSRLIVETSENARMESELLTVKAVQETLFPKKTCQFGPLSIVGHYEPASECGGDWWSYSQIEDMIYLWIGDATGHGASAALITSAARSAAAVIEGLGETSPGEALKIMNHAIYETSKGKILMTFFLAAINPKTGVMTYACASHDPPFLIRSKDQSGKLKKSDLEPLIEVNGHRLGDIKGAVYAEEEIKLEKGDVILFYTDGVIDLENKKAIHYGERRFLREVVQSFSLQSSLEEKVDDLVSSIESYREGVPLVDDVTMFACQYGEAG